MIFVETKTMCCRLVMKTYLGFLVTETLVQSAFGMIEQFRPGGGYQYNSFSGPVSGPIEEIAVPKFPPWHHKSYIMTHDFKARPDYAFAYGVEDPDTGNTQNHYETRAGDEVTGKYTVVEPDGMLRVVTYSADPDSGFQATVTFEKPNYSYAQPYKSLASETTTSPPSYDYYTNY
ncbi:cuticle protein 7-like isoform X1 [Nilaparvata lugens]|uniref:cuticle protein 7-like isoform X1 n=1 Tax=Nilaparvata lugens TaxID=108931 RepID=UPI000B991745|nr:cuticle protein 7-like isoform X1 [Nilaparvata lugens]